MKEGMKKGLRLIAWYKGIIGVLAVLLALGAMFYGEANLKALIFRMAQAELQEDPSDFFYNLITPYIPLLNPNSFWLFFGSTLLFGLTHLVLAYEISKERYWPIVWVFWALVIFLPFELVGLLKFFRMSRTLILCVNLAIVLYLYFYIRKFHKTFNLMKHLDLKVLK
jgi:uncharacterized membrane protein (DUF2068 family)